MLEIKDVREHLWVNPNHTWEDYNKRRDLSKIKFIVIHHTKNIVNDVKTANELDINNKTLHPLGFPRIRYHYFINEKGEVSLCNDLRDVTWHSRLADKKSIAVGVVGDYDMDKPKKENLEVLGTLLEKLTAELNLPRKSVCGHGELRLYLNFTSCPGKNLLPHLGKYRETGELL